MIIQTGMRTDISAFYSKWFLNLIAFCTKNPLPMLPFLDRLKPYGQYWFVTITPYGKDIEPNVPDKEIVMEGFKELSDVVGVDSVGWRYDPIFIDKKHSVEWHISEFEKMAELLSGYTKTCVISFIDIYKKVEHNFPEAKSVQAADMAMIGKAFVKIASKYGMALKPCAEGEELAKYGADCSGCMTVHTFETALHSRLEIPKRKKNQRNGECACACLLGTDIGAYDTCGHLCKYCYANVNPVLVKENMKKHNPMSPFLLGESMPGDIVREAIQKSWIDRQIRLEF